jgi:hypothetical protein
MFNGWSCFSRNWPLPITGHFPKMILLRGS